MIERIDPRIILVVGFVLVVTGFVLPFLMVMKIIESTFFLNFFSYGASLVGVVCGFVGAAYYVRSNRRGRK